MPERDFNVCDVEANEILRKMARSGCVVVVLSCNYMYSNKCLFDLATAYGQRRLYDQKIFAVLLGNMPHDVLKQDVKALELVESGRRFAQWPSDDDQRHQERLRKQREKFWYRLSSVLYTSMTE